MALQKAFPIGNGKPINSAQGFVPRSWPCTLPFFTNGVSTYAVQQPLADVGLDNVQTVFIDNSNSNTALILQFPGANEKCVCPPYSQGFFPVLFLGGPNISFTAQSGGNVDTLIQFINVGGDVLPAIIWAVSTPQGQGVQTIQGIVNVQPSVGAFADRGGAIQTAATSQTLMNANGTRKRIIIKNPASPVGQGFAAAAAAESLFINFGAPASCAAGQMTSLELQPGEGYDSATGPVSSQQIFVTAVTAGHVFIAKEM